MLGPEPDDRFDIALADADQLEQLASIGQVDPDPVRHGGLLGTRSIGRMPAGQGDADGVQASRYGTFPVSSTRVTRAIRVTISWIRETAFSISSIRPRSAASTSAARSWTYPTTTVSGLLISCAAAAAPCTSGSSNAGSNVCSKLVTSGYLCV